MPAGDLTSNMSSLHWDALELMALRRQRSQARCGPVRLQLQSLQHPQLREPHLCVLAGMVRSRSDAVAGQELRDLLRLRLKRGVGNHGACRGQRAAWPQQREQRLPGAASLRACTCS